MKLVELADSYREAAALLKVALEDTEEKIRETSGGERIVLEQKAKDLRAALRQTREVRHLVMTYYTERQRPEYTCVNMRCSRIDSGRVGDGL